jgi:hypothetical protein
MDGRIQPVPIQQTFENIQPRLANRGDSLD